MSTSERRAVLGEDWLTVVLAFAFIVLTLIGFRPATPAFAWSSATIAGVLSGANIFNTIWFGAYLLDLGGFTPLLFAFDDREKILDLLEGITGARLTYCYYRFGGLYNDVDQSFIDGTKEFVRGGDDYTVNIALVMDGIPIVGAVFAPATGRLHGGIAGRAAWLDEGQGRTAIACRTCPTPPIVVMCMGLDSAKEEMASNENVFLKRGMATLTFDGPGQGEAEYALPIRGDYESAVKSVVDWVERRDDVDGSRIGLWGVSLGGYYAPRAAAFEKRVKACIALSGPYDWAEIWPQLPELTREAFRARAKCATQEEARAVGATLTLKDVAEKITCPLFIVAGKLDRLVPWQHGERLARETGGEVEFLLIEDGNHVANNRAYKYRTQSADWMGRHLGATAR